MTSLPLFQAVFCRYTRSMKTPHLLSQDSVQTLSIQSISGKVWLDLNKNGRKDDDEDKVEIMDSLFKKQEIEKQIK